MNKYSWNACNGGPDPLDVLARAGLLAGDPALDRRLAALADADPLGLRVPRRDSPVDRQMALRDHASPERHAYRLPTQVDRPAASREDRDG